VTLGPEPADAPALGLEGIDRKCIVISSTRMGDMIGATTDGTVIPGIDNIENQRNVFS
jgi:hypothetical protein